LFKRQLQEGLSGPILAFSGWLGCAHKKRIMLMWWHSTPAAVEAAEETSRFLPEHFWSGVVGSAIFGLVGIALLLLGYWLFDRVTPRLDVQKELSDKNIAVAVVIGALLLSIAYITAHVVQ
jgi:putative membrane protein